MKKLITCLIAASLPFASSSLHADGLDDFKSETEALWSPNDKAPDTSQEAQIGTSMIAWGIGLFVAIAVAFGLLKTYNSTSSSSGTT